MVNSPEQYCSFKRKDQKNKFEKKLKLQLDAAEILIKRGNNDDQKVARAALKKIYREAFNLTVNESLKNRAPKGQKSLELLAFHNENLMSFDALKALWAYGDKKYSEIVRKKLRNIAQQNDSPHQFEAAQYLCAEQDSIGFKVMQLIAQQANHKKRDEAAQFLNYKSKSF